MGIVDSADQLQRRRTVLGLPIAVIYKFVDDQGAYLAAIITYYAFIAIFPMLLLASSILGFVVQGNGHLQNELLNSALGQFPIVGTQLGRPEGLEGSTGAVVFGALAATYGSLGLGQALQNAMNVSWSVPRNSRPNPILLRLKSLLLLSSAGIAVLCTSVLSALGSGTEVFGPHIDSSIRWLIRIATVLAIWLVLTLLFRLAAARAHHVGAAAPGALAVALMWQLLQYVGTWFAKHAIAETSTMNATFGLVLGLIGIIYMAAFMGVLGMELNVVLARRLWPRALLTVFTDNVELTEADRRAYAGYARSQRHKGFENVQVTWNDLRPTPIEQPASTDDVQHTG